MPAGYVVLWLLAMLLILLLNAFFVATEFALVASRRSKIKEMVKDGHSLAVIVQKLQENIGRSVSGTQLGITLCSLGLGWVAENSINRAVNLLFGSIPTMQGFTLPPGLGLAVSFLILSSLHVVLGEQVPKFLALSIPEKIALKTAPLFRVYCWLAWPLIWLMDSLAAGLLRFTGIAKIKNEEAHLAHSADELEILFEASQKAGELGERETDLLKRVLDLRDIRIDGVLNPVSRVDAVSISLNLPALLRVVSKTKHSRLPVYRGNIDNIVGVLYTRDLFEWWLDTLTAADGRAVKDFKAEKFIRPAFIVDRSHKASTLLDDMRKRRVQIALVKDGSKLVGMVTMEDLIEELVGPIDDEHDEKVKSTESLP